MKAKGKGFMREAGKNFTTTLSALQRVLRGMLTTEDKEKLKRRKINDAKT